MAPTPRGAWPATRLRRMRRDGFSRRLMREHTLTPADLGLERAAVGAVAGGEPGENATDMCAIVEGEADGPKRDIILANAGAALYIADEADSLEAGVSLAREAIDSGAAAEKLADLRGVGG